MKQKKLPIGISDFKDVITGHYYYIDKTLFIKDIIDKGSKILLIPRPRRFGKTLNLSMIKYFYDCCPEKILPTPDGTYPTNPKDLPGNSYKSLFENLNINSTDKEYTDKMGKHPVIFLSFRNIKDKTWDVCWDKIQQLIINVYITHYYLLSSPNLLPDEKDYFKRIINRRGSAADYENSLEILLIFLNRYYGERVVILIDEYDAPIHAGYSHQYYDEIINFIRNFLGSALKDRDQFLEKSVITGILRVAKESIFSGLNNASVYTLTSSEFNDKFGFTENEIETLLTNFQLLNRYDDIKKWYNGYIFGNLTIYNPWSIINFLENYDHETLPYWINTASNELIESLLSKGGIELKKELEQLLRGDSIDKIIDENITMKELPTKEYFLWSFLLLTGYLKYTAKRRDDSTSKMILTLSIPNLEVKTAYVNIVETYFSTKIENEKLEAMLKALIDGDIALFEKLLRMIVSSIFSYHDFGKEPEKVYHALVTGLLVWISNTHEIKSNRESGYGRYDIMIIPKNPQQVGYIMEFKTIDLDENESVPTAIKNALNQIEEKQYESELIQRGILHFKKLAIVFNGKYVTVADKAPE